MLSVRRRRALFAPSLFMSLIDDPAGDWYAFSRAEDWVWTDSVRLAIAMPGCGIAATSWRRDGTSASSPPHRTLLIHVSSDGLEEIGLYFQNPSGNTVELRLSYSACGYVNLSTLVYVPS